MNDQSSTPNDPLAPPKQALSADALARRRLLLRGASGGAAALAALQPIGALATTQTSTVLTCLNGSGKESLCSLSGVNSGAHSFGPNIQKILAKGKAPTYWPGQTTWPAGCSSTCNKSTIVSTLFPGCNYGTKTVLYVLQTYPTSIEAYFISAYLNGASYYSATTPTAALNFPYPSSKVVEFWNAQGDTRTNAFNLFKGISTLTS